MKIRILRDTKTEDFTYTLIVDDLSLDEIIRMQAQGEDYNRIKGFSTTLGTFADAIRTPEVP